MSGSQLGTADVHPEPDSEGRLPGDLSIWLIVALELATFALLFIAYAVARALDTELFNSSQQTLDRSKGVLNTWLLIGGSWCVVRAVQAMKACLRRSCLAWLLAAQACGAVFVVLKLGEYAAKWAVGIDLETNRFYMFYFLLTGFHLLHVVAAMAVLALLSLSCWRRGCGPEQLHALETGAAFWHLVDLLWIVLFPLLYILR